MKIALDYDETITRDPVLWSQFVYNAVAHGHDVRVVTFRSANHSNRDLKDTLYTYNMHIPVIYTEATRKRQYCAQIGFFPDVWIDDMPELIVRDDTYIPGEMLAKQMSYQGGACDCNRPDCPVCKLQWEGRN